jgi:hypothetical protein
MLRLDAKNGIIVRRNEMHDRIIEIIRLVSSARMPLHNEKELQKYIGNVFFKQEISFEREYKLDDDNIPDFFIDGIAIEVKIKGSKRAIYKQCERYCKFETVKTLILVTNRSMGFPKQINGKDCYVVLLGKAWL